MYQLCFQRKKTAKTWNPTIRTICNANEMSGVIPIKLDGGGAFARLSKDSVRPTGTHNYSSIVKKLRILTNNKEKGDEEQIFVQELKIRQIGPKLGIRKKL